MELGPWGDGFLTSESQGQQTGTADWNRKDTGLSLSNSAEWSCASYFTSLNLRCLICRKDTWMLSWKLVLRIRNNVLYIVSVWPSCMCSHKLSNKVETFVSSPGQWVCKPSQHHHLCALVQVPPRALSASLSNLHWIEWMELIHVNTVTQRSCLLLPAISSHKKLWFLSLLRSACPIILLIPRAFSKFSFCWLPRKVSVTCF